MVKASDVRRNEAESEEKRHRGDVVALIGPEVPIARGAACHLIAD